MTTSPILLLHCRGVQRFTRQEWREEGAECRLLTLDREKKKLRGGRVSAYPNYLLNNKWTFPAEDAGAVEVHEQRGTNQRQVSGRRLAEEELAAICVI